MTREELENIKQTEDVLASIAIENMFLDKNFIKELIQVDMSQKTCDEIRQELLEKYTE